MPTPQPPAPRSLLEPARELPVMHQADVVVVGGGIAGVAAAVAAAREGARVCLVERTFALGGLATLGNVIIWLPICDGLGNQVMAGIPEELLRLSVEDLKQDNRTANFRGIPACWQPGGSAAARAETRYQVSFNPSSYMLSMEAWLLQAGVALLYDTRLCSLHKEGPRITHLVVENKSGRSAIACQTVVDASGDADLCYLAGESTESLDTNVLAGWFFDLRANGLHLHAMTNQYSPYAVREGAQGPFFRGDCATDVTAHVLATRELIRTRMRELRQRDPGQEIQLVNPPTLPCFRMTRRLVGRVSLSETHQHVWFDDAIGFTGDWRKAGPVYAIPWRAMAATHTVNLVTAGRCISADTTAWDVTRAIPTCALTGAAAGTGAALACRQDDRGNTRDLPIDRLRQGLTRQGFLLDRGLLREKTPSV